LRQERRAVPSLVRLLAEDHRALAPLALVALGQIGDPAGLDAVIDYSTGRPAGVQKQAIEAVRHVGGHRGRAWLFTLSTGHDDPDVQMAAEAALASLEVAPTAELAADGDVKVR
jgi:HEAT repeat protein